MSARPAASISLIIRRQQDGCSDVRRLTTSYWKTKPSRSYEMSKDLLCKLELLEADYFSQPVVAQQADLREINHIRSQLGMPLVDARLTPIGTAAVEEDVEEEAQPEPEA